MGVRQRASHLGRPSTLHRHPPSAAAEGNDLVLLTREDGEIIRDVPGFGLFYCDTCYVAAYALRLHGAKPLILMSSDEQGWAARIALANCGSPAPQWAERCAASNQHPTILRDRGK